ncbi:Rossmann-like and DUF2520 domain-containing protein [Leucobacter sp. wl10]|uniref:Rossmann-like and DUF2520 domain-containing protein n=1 Tax=Leucobacter sp. wl10 TaxID=2304677 RepID=UPI000E5AEB12|nr:Rossmann-like and DUF2520 domain-containing protein [Leucobacter sp. wl10]RGE21859.1 DUF2520 domain-containing protein [Leucobacter sp. wl10]
MRVQIIGRGRMGTALAEALRGAGVEVPPPAGRGATGDGAEVVLLAVPDAAIAEAASLVAPGRLVGHLSGATGLDPLRPHEAFSLHPLLAVTGAGSSFAGAHAAIDGSDEEALAAARELAGLLGMQAFRVADEDRAAYHAAASAASNFLVVVEGFAERLAASAGVPREALVPLARAALSNWGELGAAAALTGPVTRGDEATVAGQRAAVADRSPGDLELFDALVRAARELVADPELRRSGGVHPSEGTGSAAGEAP